MSKKVRGRNDAKRDYRRRIKMLTHPIPVIARDIVAAIRRKAKRQKELPRPKTKNKNYLRWETDLKRCCVRAIHCGLPALFCPMGLLPNALCSSPANRDDFLECTFDNRAIRAFADWWDKQIDAEAAVLAVWGRKRSVKK
jgi:hypothetical protein